MQAAREADAAEHQRQASEAAAAHDELSADFAAASAASRQDEKHLRELREAAAAALRSLRRLQDAGGGSRVASHHGGGDADAAGEDGGDSESTLAAEVEAAAVEAFLRHRRLVQQHTALAADRAQLQAQLERNSQETQVCCAACVSRVGPSAFLAVAAMAACCDVKR